MFIIMQVHTDCSRALSCISLSHTTCINNYIVKNNLAGMRIGLVVECSQCAMVEDMLTGRWHQLETGW